VVAEGTVKMKHEPGGWTTGWSGKQRRMQHGTGRPSRGFTFLSLFYIRGTHTPRCAHSAMMRAEDSPCCGLRQEPRPVSFVFFSSFSFIPVVYIPLWGKGL
jgi:hypothetical protein